MIAVIGQGFVGGSLTTVFSERDQRVFTYDKAGKAAEGGISKFHTQAGDTISPNSLTDFISLVENNKDFLSIYFVCLPTPMRQDGSCDLSIVESVLDDLSKNNIRGLNRVAVVKSTVPPGTTETWNKKYESSLLRVVFCPEFLTEANALNDMRNQDRIILGGPGSAVQKVSYIFKETFPGVPLFQTTSTNAEMVKYVANCFLATKVSFANEMYQACKALSNHGHDISYNSVIELAKLDRRLGESHWQVPGPMPSDDTGEPAFGFSGSCFPKDMNALIHLLQKNGVDPKVLKGAWEKNVEVRPQRDWEKLKGRAVSTE
jgi:UDPglucose 6-dehydrogenase